MNVTTSAKPLYHGMKVNREQYLKLEEDGFKYDMIDGVLHMTPSVNSDHGICQTRLAQIFWNYLDEYPIGKALSEIDIFLPDNGDVLRPDLTVVLNKNDIIKKHIFGVPDLVCEILSSRTKKRDLNEKAERYLFNGIPEYWIVNPQNRSLEMWSNEEKKHWRKFQGKEINSYVMERLTINVKDVFR